jgi:hypothetical protein
MTDPLRTLAILAVAIFLGACSNAAGGRSPSPSQPFGGCSSGPPEAGVHNPDRLQVLARCKHAEGTVTDVAREDDGDYHVWFRADPAYEYLLNPQDHFQAKPAMLAEITPRCPLATNPPDARSAARCPKSKLTIPKLGDRIAIDGPWVLDTDHGWREIHPVDVIRIIGHA